MVIHREKLKLNLYTIQKVTLDNGSNTLNIKNKMV